RAVRLVGAAAALVLAAVPPAQDDAVRQPAAAAVVPAPGALVRVAHVAPARGATAHVIATVLASIRGLGTPGYFVRIACTRERVVGIGHVHLFRRDFRAGGSGWLRRRGRGIAQRDAGEQAEGDADQDAGELRTHGNLRPGCGTGRMRG